jgi:YHS domain-containing protein
VAVGESTVTYTFIGVTYFFCSTECCDLFKRAPERHLVYLAHEPGNEHYGYCCPTQRLLRANPLA